MRLITNSESASWCKKTSLTVTTDYHLYYADRSTSIALGLPTKPYQLVSLADTLLPDDDETRVQTLLWFRVWGVWNKTVEDVGARVLELVRTAYGQSRRLIEAPGYLFDPDERRDLLVCLVQALLIGWDAFLIPVSGDYIVATSHDETIRIVSRTQELHEGLLRRLATWEPQEDRKWPTP